MRAEVEIEMMGSMASVKINGVEHNMAIRSYTIHHEAGERPTVVTAELVGSVPFETGNWRDIVDLRLGEYTLAVLDALGWTPPSEEHA